MDEDKAVEAIVRGSSVLLLSYRESMMRQTQLMG